MNLNFEQQSGGWKAILSVIAGIFMLCMPQEGLSQVNANFSANRQSGCSPLSVSFTDLSSGNIHTWFWDFGNGNTSTFDNVIATYTNPGTYTVSLTVTDTINGFVSVKTETAYITVFEDPAADFTADSLNGCAPLTVNFTDNSIATDGNITSWIWDFGDGNVSNLSNPTHTYTAGGAYTVTLVVQDENGCQDTRIYNDLINATELANVDFSASQQTACGAPLTVNFTSNISPAGAYTYLWDFGDGTFSTATNPSHTYNINGDYTVTLTISDGNNCSASETKTNFIIINEPTADFIALNPTACSGVAVQFANNSTGADSYFWTFGDGNTSTAANPSHTYNVPGTYTVSLTATNSAGCNDFIVQNNYVTINPSPAAGFSATNNIGCSNPLVVSFQDNSAGTIIAWNWNFGNGNTSTGQNPTTTYTTPGLYDVSVTVTNNFGCQSTETIPSYVQLREPDAEFNVSRAEGCVPLTVNFIDISTSPADPIVSWVWNFGDGNVSNQQNPTHTYSAAGQYTVTLTVMTQDGCQDVEILEYVEAGYRPTANFSANPLLVCVNEVVNFTDISAGTVTEWQWDFGDGNGSTNENPIHQYQDTGTFDIMLIVEHYGCRDTLLQEDYITVYGPIANFMMTPTQGCNPPSDITFTDLSINGTSWLWDFGDGNTSTQQNPVHTYLNPGNYIITLVVDDAVSGCTDDFILPLNITQPQAAFIADEVYGCSPHQVNFQNSSVSAVSYTWDFGDGTISTAANPTYTYNNPGIYDVTLVASDGVCSDTLIRTAYIEVIGPSAAFSSDITTGCTPLPVSFSDLSTPNSGTTITNWLWDFGDGGVSTQQNPIYTYNTPGLYDVSLTVLDSEGCINTFTIPNMINPTFPTANFISPDSIACPGSFVSFVNQSSGSGMSYLWDFGDGTFSTAVNPTHMFPASASYTISLTATDINGCSHTLTRTNYITVGQPTAAFFADNTSATCPPLTVNFTDQSSANVNSWLWDFGDGSTSTLANPSKIYAVAGSYDITLVVRTPQGCRDTLYSPNLINISGPSGAFTFSPTSGCRPLNVNFSATSPDPNWTYEWDFGDGTGSIGTNVSHTYIVDTTAVPIMIVEDQNGCRVPIRSSGNINILPLPNPSYEANITQVCLGQSVSFTNTSTSKRSITNFFWDFGDGNSSTAINPTHIYADTGSYTVILTLTTVDGCTNSSPTPVTIRVTEPPTAFFAASPTEGCEPFAVNFTDGSSGPYPIVDWTWNFGDGSAANGQTILPHVYNTAGIYSASLTVTDTKGCSGTASRSIRVNPLPPVQFSAFRYGCAPISIAFSDNTLGTSASVAWLWDFGDGTTSSVQNPIHTYATNGNYTVSLTVTDAKGCTYTHTEPDYIQLEVPTANFISNAGITCPPQTVQFTDISSADTTISWQWFFGDGGTSSQQNPQHTYYGADTFDVTLIITDIFGCSDTIVKPQHVINYQRPVASFTVSDSADCAPLSAIFTSTSTPTMAPLTSFQWDFGTGSGSTGSSSSYLFTTPGTFTVSLQVTDANGCRDTAYKNVEVFPNPTANFQAGDTIGCSITSITFTDLSTGVYAPISWSWNFGDGNTGSSQNPTNTYFNDGTYTVSLTVTDVNGCTDAITRTDYIYLDHPNAQFTSDRTEICPGESVAFTDQSTGMANMVAWRWSFGDGNTSNLQNPSHAYNTPGSYNVQLIITDALGCKDTILKPLYIDVHTPPTAEFTSTPPQGCSPLSVVFNDASVNGTNAVVNWSWDFGDGSGTSTVPNPTYIYANAGVYTVTLTVTDANGCTDQVSHNVESLDSPEVDFTADKRIGCAPETINFSDLTNSSYIIVSWLWNFGDGTTSTLPDPSHTYTSDGVYNVSLRVVDQNGCTDSISKKNFIRLTHPVAAYSLSQTKVCPNSPVGVTFTDKSIPDTTITNWFWDFGDGNTSNLQNPSHSYSAPGVYTVSLTITNIIGCQDTYSQTNIIEVLTPATPDFAMSDSANCTPLTISFTDLSTPGDASIVAWNWDFGNGTGSLAQNPTYTWNTAGVYTVTLTTTDNNGCQTSDSVQVHAREIPVAGFMSADTLGCAPQTVSFVNQTTSAYLVNYTKWLFGDGDSAVNLLNPTHTYANDGVYTVTLIVTDINGCSDTLVKPNYIRLSHPVAQFSIDQNTVCPGSPVGVTFTDLSIADTTLVSWFWNFGDGSTSTQQNPSHSYTTPGVYSVSLVVTNVLGCSDGDTITNNITVLAPPVAAFTVSDSADCTPLSVNFTDGSAAGDAAITTWSWDFGDGNTSLQTSPSHTYTTAGTYQASLTITDSNGCESTATQNIQSYANPVVDFAASDTVGCASFTVSFSSLATASAPIANWSWDFGDGNTSNQQNPSHTYTVNGNYDISLEVTDNRGCTTTLQKSSYINLTNPVADFTYGPSMICPGTIVTFQDASTPDHPLVSWTWDFGDGATSNQQNPTHLYTTPGIYTVSLTVTNNLGCGDTEIKSAIITVRQAPTSAFTPSTTDGCEPLSVVFTNNSTQGDAVITNYIWDFGDGTTSSLTTVNHTFSPAGVYPVSLIATDAFGCKDTSVQDITVFERPVANFNSSDSVGCSSIDITFFDQSSSSVPLAGWVWNFGNGNTSTSPVPVNTYTTDGNYSVSLIVTDVNGCKDTVSKANYIQLSHPVADFSADNPTVCPGTTINFTDNSVPDTTLMTWLWDFGDGTTSNSQNPSHAYANPGLYTVSLTITNVLNCSDTEIKADMIEVLTPATTSFAASDTIGCYPLIVSFTDNSTANSAPIVGWFWDFDNGNTSTLQNPSAVFSGSGIFTVTLTTTDNNGCTSSFSRDIETLIRPEAQFFTDDTVGCTGVVTFTDLSGGNQPIVSWFWDFGDGNTSTLQNPTHNYTATGNYTVSLVVTDNFGCSDTLIKTDYIKLTRPVAAFYKDFASACPGETVSFEDASVPDHPLVAWNWNFGDGSTSTQQNPQHTFTQPGIYQVSLIITNMFGCTDTAVESFEVLTPPQARFTPSQTSGCTPLTVAFTDNSTGNSAPVIFWDWNFGDGGTSSAQNPTHIFSSPGNYTIYLRVIDGNGCDHDTTMQVDVLPLPTPDFTVNRRVGCAPQAIQFTSTSTSNFPIVSWEWDFGDGNTGTGQSVSHTYSTDGVFTISLVITDANGCSDTLTRPDYIRLTHPEADFVWTPSAGCPGLSVDFTDASIVDTTINQWQWNFGDGTTSTLQNPVHVYNTPGAYTVTLTVTNVLNCSDTEIKTNIIEVYTPPTAGFLTNTAAGCMPLTVNFTNASVGGTASIVSYNWNFGDGSTSGLLNPSHTFSQAGTYNVRLLATDANGCVDSVLNTIIVRPLPQPTFTVSDSLGCSPFSVNFTDQTFGSSPIVDWQWDFGDGNTGTGAFPSHTYNADGIYTVSLTVTDANGCSGSVVKPDLIKLSHPVADFTLDQSTVCPGTQINFSNASTPDTTITSYLWNFGDGQTSGLQNPGHIYNNPGTYTVSLTITNIFNCSDTRTMVDTIEVRQIPTAQFTPSTLSGCAPLNVSFTNTTIPTSGPIADWFWDFGNGSTSVFTNATTTFSNPGVYSVKLVATDGFGCSDTVSRNITAFEVPTAGLMASDSVGCAPTTIQFLDQSVAGDAPINSWLWNFGDGGASTQQFPNHTYGSDGIYSVSLRVEDANGCRDTVVRSQYIRLSHPVADFTTNSGTLCPGTVVNFLDQSIPDTTIVSWQWNFGDGSTSTQVNPSHTYTTGGNYTVTLTVTNVLGCSHTRIRTNVVGVLVPPTTMFVAGAPEGCAPFTNSFTDMSTGNSAPVVSWLWDFGDGSTSTAQNPNHTFVQPGTYTVTLTTTDNNGCSSSFSRDITSLTLPVANFMTPDTLGCSPIDITFTDLSTGNYPITGWQWSFGDGGSSTQQNPTHTYTNDGNYSVGLIATDINGCKDTLVKQDYIRLTNPQADFSYDQPNGCPGLLVTFEDESVADTTLVSWFWNFGDGSTSIVQNPTHVYAGPGTYTVSLTITNAIGCSKTRTVVNAIYVSVPPVAAFNLSDTLGCTPLTIVTFDQTQSVSAPVVDWLWKFGNGDTSNLQEPVYTYQTPGTYQVTMIVQDGLGCVDSASRTVVSAARPVANFSSPDTVGCAPQDVQFSDLSSGTFQIVQWAWNFGDGTTSSLRNPSHTYQQDGNYTVTLVVTDINGCTDTMVMADYIRLSHPEADFISDITDGCIDSEVQFTSTTIADTTLTGWAWDFGDGGISVQQHPSHTYTQSGMYDVSLIVTNILGCKDTVEYQNQVEIYESPTVAISASDTSGCVPFQVDFEDFSTSPYGINGWQWLIDKSPVAVSQNMSFFFTNVGVYEVTLVITDNNGCTDSVTQMIYVRPQPVANFGASDTIGCAPETITFNDLTVHTPTSWLWDFGDGQTSNQQNPVHTYQNDGIYSVRLYVEDQYGCSDEIEKINYIVLDHPQASFTVDYDPGCPPLETTFHAIGGGLKGIATWHWDFGDGSATSTITDSVMHEYTQPGTYSVTLRAVDSMGCEVTVIEPDMVTVTDNIIPGLISIYNVSVVSDNQVEVRFGRHADNDFMYYTIYREQPGVGYVPIQTLDYINDTIFIDNTVNATQSSYCYKVTVTNQCNTESALNSSRSHCTIEALATPVPGEIVVTWNRYQGWNVNQYEVYRVNSYNKIDVTFLGVVPGNLTRYEDPVEDCFSNFAYRIRAIGQTPEQESWSDTTLAVGSNGTAGQAASVVRATVVNNEATLVEWKPIDMPGAAIVYVEKSFQGQPFTIVATVEPGVLSYLDQDVDVQRESYTYRVSAQDSCGSYTPESNIGKTIVLEARTEVGTNVLNWTEYQEWRFGVDAYRIEILNDTTGQWETVDIVQGNIFEYRDTKTTLDQPKYCYRVVAVELGGNKAESVSNEACLSVETTFYAPNAFTPNNDGVNDLFTLSGLHVLTFNMKIYSRWGMLLYETNNIEDGWNGKYNGQDVNEGVYVFIARGTGYNGQPYIIKGALTLIR